MDNTVDRWKKKEILQKGDFFHRIDATVHRTNLSHMKALIQEMF